MDQTKFIFLGFCFWACAAVAGEAKGRPQALPERTFKICGRSVKLEVARSDEERSLGLGHRDSLPKGKGMLFVFEYAAPLTFWMKDVAFDIDIGFFGNDGRLQRAMTMKGESPLKREEALPRYDSLGNSRYAVELPAGFFKPADAKSCRLAPLP